MAGARVGSTSSDLEKSPSLTVLATISLVFTAHTNFTERPICLAITPARIRSNKLIVVINQIEMARLIIYSSIIGMKYSWVIHLE